MKVKTRTNELYKNAAVDTFETMIGVSVETTTHPPDTKISCYDVTCIISVLGEMPSNIALRMSDTTAANVLACYKKKHAIENTSIAYCMGELVYSLVENYRSRCNGKKFVLTAPEVITGQGHDLHFSNFKNIIELYFTSNIGNAYLIVVHGG
jgi:CheY-specific phosphatase CheX